MRTTRRNIALALAALLVIGVAGVNTAGAATRYQRWIDVGNTTSNITADSRTWERQTGFSGGGTVEQLGSVTGARLNAQVAKTALRGPDQFALSVPNGKYFVTAWVIPEQRRSVHIASEGKFRTAVTPLRGKSPNKVRRITFAAQVSDGTLNLSFAPQPNTLRLLALGIRGGWRQISTPATSTTSTTVPPSTTTTTTSTSTTTSTVLSTTTTVPGSPVATWPTAPPAQICGNTSLLSGPASPPAGATTVPAGDNIGMFFQFRQQNHVFWFAPGVHTLGTDVFGQIEPGSGSTYIGAPGAIIDGQNINRFAFTQQATNVTIKHLTIRNFDAPLDQGVVNHDAGDGWTIEYNTIADNEGAGLMAGPNNRYEFNCIKDNGQYGINACCGGETASTEIHNFVLRNNEITGNNTGDWERNQPGCGCTGGVKFWLNNDVTVTNNWVHHNKGVGLWLDNNNRGFTIEHNYISDNEGQAIFTEAGYDASIRHNNIVRNAHVVGREFQSRGDPFPTAAIYVSEAGSPTGYGLKIVPTVISNNNFDNNWGGVAMWENADRYSGSSAHTHVSGTIKIGDLHHDTQCKSGVPNVIPSSIGDKYKCRWSTENVIVENNVFKIDKGAVGAGCAGANFCGINGIFSNSGSFPEFSGYTIPWRITFQQGNVFRNNTYYGDWRFAGFETARPDGQRVTRADWTAPAPAVPSVFTHDNRPTTFGQDVGSTFNP